MIQYLQRTQETQQPIVRIVNGKAEVVVRDGLAYKKLLDRLEYAESMAAICKGIEEFDRGKGKPVRETLED